MDRVRIDVQGMTCANCAVTIAEAVESLPGVNGADASYAVDEATVEYDPDRTSLADIYEAIEDAGYDPVSETLTVAITDMTCANCAATVEDAVADIPGTISVSANVATDEAQVRIDPAAVGREDVYEAIEAAGYTPVREGESVENGDGGDARERARAAGTRRQRRLVLFGAAFSLPLLVLSMGHLVGIPVPETLLGVGLGWVLFALSTPVQIVLGKGFYENAFAALVRNRTANMDVLVALGSTTAYLYSVLTLTGTLVGGRYFETAGLILTFITLGNYLEARSKSRAGQAIRELLELEADTAVVVDEVGGDERQVPLREVEVGDLLKVRPGGKIPTDGEVVDGESAVDESMVTGESVPVEKTPGEAVIGGTVNESGLLYVRATKVGEQTALQQIVRTVTEAQSRQPEVQRVADRISAYFVPAVVTNALVWALLWFAFPEVLAGVVRALPLWGLVGGGPGATSTLEFAVVVFASAVLIACPCALGLATPAATMVGTTIGARNGILFRGGDVLERVRDVEAVVFDKTGTLTEGEMTLTDAAVVAPVGDGGIAERRESASDSGSGAGESGRDGLGTDALLALAARAERGSEHPIAEAIVAAARERGHDPEEPAAFRSAAGEGVVARVDGATVLVGSRRLLARAGIDTAPADAAMERLEGEGKTAILVARTDAGLDAVADAGSDDDPGPVTDATGELLGVLAVADTVKPAAREAVTAFRERGVAVHLLTGDNERTARAVAEDVGIDPANVRAGVLPGEKAEAVEAIQADGTQAMMVGDGVNDAPALAAASVGVAIGSGTDVAIEAADVTLLRSDPMDAVRALRISEGTLSKVRQNLLWALGYNTAMIPLASLGLLQPVYAAVAMALSSVSVLTNSLLFRAYDPDREYRILGRFR